MFNLFHHRCHCGGRIRKIEFYLDPFKHWDRYFLCRRCGRRAVSIDALRSTPSGSEQYRLAA